MPHWRRRQHATWHKNTVVLGSFHSGVNPHRTFYQCQRRFINMLFNEFFRPHDHSDFLEMDSGAFDGAYQPLLKPSSDLHVYPTALTKNEHVHQLIEDVNCRATAGSGEPELQGLPWAAWAPDKSSCHERSQQNLPFRPLMPAVRLSIPFSGPLTRV